jgi:hypothetical protein
LILAGLGVSGCSGSSDHHSSAPAVRVERIAGTTLTRVELSPDAVTRIGIQSARPRTASGPRGQQLAVIPYAAVLYDPNGAASAYTSPAPRVYIRHPIELDHTTGSEAFVKHGLPPGAAVIAVGAPELLGAETGVEG